jgi:hypothetical protein
MIKQTIVKKILMLQSDGYFSDDELIFWASQGLMTYNKETLMDMLNDAEDEYNERIL